MKAHPYAEIFPMFEPGPLKELSIDIKINGQQEEIDTIKHEGVDKILDGRNRYKACLLAGVEPQFKEYLGDDPLGYVISKNKIRRNLTPGELAEVAAKIATMTRGHQSNPPNGGFAGASESGSKKVSQAEAAEMVGASVRSVQRAVAKSKPKKEKEVPGWTVEQVKEDEELHDALKAIALVYGNEDTKAIRTGAVGLKRNEVIQLAKLPDEKMKEIQDLVLSEHWTPKQALEHLGRMATESSDVGDIIHWCVATKGKYFTADFRDGAFTLTMKANRALKRA